MVDFNWRVDVVCAAILRLNFILIVKYWVQDTWYFIPTFCNPFLNSKYCLIPSQYFSQIPGFIRSGFVIFFITGGGESSHLFCSPRMVLNLCSSSLRKCNVCTVRFFKKNTLLYSDGLLILNHVGKAECSSTIPGHGRGINTAQQY